MRENHPPKYPPAGKGKGARASSDSGVMRRRDFIRTGASGLAGAALATAACRRAPENQNAGPLANLRSTTPADLQGLVGTGGGAASCYGEASCSPSTPSWETSTRRTS